MAVNTQTVAPTKVVAPKNVVSLGGFGSFTLPLPKVAAKISKKKAKSPPATTIREQAVASAAPAYERRREDAKEILAEQRRSARALQSAYSGVAAMENREAPGIQAGWNEAAKTSKHFASGFDAAFKQASIERKLQAQNLQNALRPGGPNVADYSGAQFAANHSSNFLPTTLMLSQGATAGTLARQQGSNTLLRGAQALHSGFGAADKTFAASMKSAVRYRDVDEKAMFDKLVVARNKAATVAEQLTYDRRLDRVERLTKERNQLQTDYGTFFSINWATGAITQDKGPDGKPIPTADQRNMDRTFQLAQQRATQAGSGGGGGGITPSLYYSIQGRLADEIDGAIKPYLVARIDPYGATMSGYKPVSDSTYTSIIKAAYGRAVKFGPPLGLTNEEVYVAVKDRVDSSYPEVAAASRRHEKLRIAAVAVVAGRDAARVAGAPWLQPRPTRYPDELKASWTPHLEIVGTPVGKDPATMAPGSRPGSGIR